MDCIQATSGLLLVIGHHALIEGVIGFGSKVLGLYIGFGPKVLGLHIQTIPVYPAPLSKETNDCDKFRSVVGLTIG